MKYSGYVSLSWRFSQTLWLVNIFQFYNLTEYVVTKGNIIQS